MLAWSMAFQYASIPKREVHVVGASSAVPTYDEEQNVAPLYRAIGTARQAGGGPAIQASFKTQLCC
ncbi:hypothetical protein CLG96_07675 [Sphingomonas oleivorans]|uniref:Uncharacterized protein n=1 Tax=Sphingomonas oleivorans TaxID=1735121 RepID=A0A2T5FYW6_9SPHN|nr:hypothetical protein CLG96_07675 [Sphingomonas oleivorans]